jgi:hypothetical protein
MAEDVSRLKKLLGDDDLGLSLSNEQSTTSVAPPPVANTGSIQVGLEAQDNDEGLEPEEYLEVFESSEAKSELPVKEPPKRLAEIGEPGDEADAESVQEPEPAKQTGGVKPFKICPYCGEDLNLPKNPNFCPYCKEPFV